MESQEYECSVSKLGSEVIVIKVQDSNTDTKTNTCSVFIPDNIGLAQTADLPATLKL